MSLTLKHHVASTMQKQMGLSGKQSQTRSDLYDEVCLNVEACVYAYVCVRAAVKNAALPEAVPHAICACVGLRLSVSTRCLILRHVAVRLLLNIFMLTTCTTDSRNPSHAIPRFLLLGG